VKAKRLVVSGRVQGVGYRWFAVRAAQELGVHGWVRNLPDGRVEALAEGSEDQIDRFVEKLRKGPLASKVQGIDALEAEPSGLTGFDVSH
jgi:acylphosphatase